MGNTDCYTWAAPNGWKASLHLNPKDENTKERSNGC